MSRRAWRIVGYIGAKDLRQRVRDRSALLLSIVAPFGLALIFSLLIGQATHFHARYAVADLDGGRLAASFRQDVLDPIAAAGVAEVVDEPTEAAARDAVGETVDAAFVIPQGFSRAIEAGQTTTLTIVGSSSDPLAADVARAVARRFGDQVTTVQLSVATVAGLRGAPLDAETQARVAAAAGDATPPIALVDVTAASRQLDLTTFFSASMAILCLFLSAQVGLVSMFDERRRGTMARILAGPVEPRTVLGGKILGAFTMSVIAMAVLGVGTSLLVGADWGPPLAVVPLVLAAILAALGISLLVASFASSAEVASAAGAAVAITLAIVGGTFTPSTQEPGVMATLALLTPHGWFLRGLAEVHGANASVTGALPAIVTLLATGLVTGGLAMVRAHRLVRAR
jgi:ABC-2 type transport system permease protein